MLSTDLNSTDDDESSEDENAPEPAQNAPEPAQNEVASPPAAPAPPPQRREDEEAAVVILDSVLVKAQPAPLYRPPNRPAGSCASRGAAAEPRPRAADNDYELRPKGSSALVAHAAPSKSRKGGREGDAVERVVSANLAPPYLVAKKELDPELRDDAESAAVWRAAQAMLRSKVEANRVVSGWQLWYTRRGNDVSGSGDIHVTPPGLCEKRPLGEYGKLRSLGALHEVLLARFEARQQGAAYWEPPALGEMVEVEVAEVVWKPDPAPAFCKADVRRVLPDGRFLACVHMPDGEADEEFMDWFGRRDEGVEWRRIAGAPTLAAQEAQKKEAERAAADAAKAARAEQLKEAKRAKARSALAVVPAPRKGELPPGWVEERRETPSGRLYKTFTSIEGGRYAVSIPEAWRLHRERHEGGASSSSPPQQQQPSRKREPAPAGQRAEPASKQPRAGLPWHTFAAAGGGMLAVSAMLQHFRLESYAEAFEEAGYDDIDYIQVLEGPQLAKLTESVGMKLGHAAKFRSFLNGEL